MLPPANFNIGRRRNPREPRVDTFEKVPAHYPVLGGPGMRKVLARRRRRQNPAPNVNNAKRDGDAVVERIFSDALERVGLNRKDYTWVWVNSGATLGTANHSRVMTLSLPFFAVLGEERLESTIRHEVGHLAHFKDPRWALHAAHGKEWKHYARMAGLKNPTARVSEIGPEQVAAIKALAKRTDFNDVDVGSHTVEETVYGVRDFRVGDQVWFAHPKEGNIAGTVHKVNKKTVDVVSDDLDDNASWRVPVGLLKPLEGEMPASKVKPKKKKKPQLKIPLKQALLSHFTPAEVAWGDGFVWFWVGKQLYGRKLDKGAKKITTRFSRTLKSMEKILSEKDMDKIDFYGISVKDGQFVHNYEIKEPTPNRFVLGFVYSDAWEGPHLK